MKVILDGDSLTFEKAQKLACGAKVEIDPQVKRRIDASRKLVTKLSRDGKPLYGINTGFGFYAGTKIDDKDLLELQSNLLQSHAAGFGEPLSLEEARLAMCLRLNVLLKGRTGVRWELCQALLKLINGGIVPVIPEKGSVGASGDLAPLAHLALPLIGLGEVFYKGKKLAARDALKKEKIDPIELQEKEGLSLINGTQIMLCVGTLALAEAERLFETLLTIASMSLEALEGHLDPFHPFLNQARGQTGQIEVARRVLENLHGSYLHNCVRHRVQDPYSLRCIPQVYGAVLDTINYTHGIIEKELNGVTDNPLVFADEGLILSGGNFHGEPLAFSFDFASIALSELGNMSERRLDLLFTPRFNNLNAFLTPHEGINSGYMAAQYLSASLVNENKLLANPSSTDSIPGNVGIEDHVSMGMTSARKLRQIVKNLYPILAAELLAAAQAIDLKKIKKMGSKTRDLYKKLRKVVPPLDKDRIIALDIEKSVEILKEVVYGEQACS
jgi:histidine ammonia-lyase